MSSMLDMKMREAAKKKRAFIANARFRTIHNSPMCAG